MKKILKIKLYTLCFVFIILEGSIIQAGIFEERRRVISSDEIPFRWVGRLLRNDKYRCTAFLVGPRHVITAAHCVEDGGDFSFQIREKQFSTGIIARVLRINFIDEFKRETMEVPGGSLPVFRNDMALLELNYQFPPNWGAFNMAEDIIDNIPAMSYGYPRALGGGTLLIWDPDGKIKYLKEDQILGDSALSGGSSGGPLVQFVDGNYVVVGVASAQYIEDDRYVYGEPYRHTIANTWFNLTPLRSTILDWIQNSATWINNNNSTR